MPTTLSRFRRQLASAVQALTLRPSSRQTRRALSAPVVTPLEPSEDTERIAGLHGECDLLAGVFEEFDALMQHYMREVPFSHQDGTADAERFLEWLATHCELSEAQRDVIVCQQSRFTVAFLAMKKRLSNARFQELLSNNTRLLPELSRNRTIRIHLNPAHVWATLETEAFLSAGAHVPARVLFYPVREAVCGAVVEEELRPMFRKLERGPRSFNELRWVLQHRDDADLLEILNDLARLGIIALA